MDSGEKKAKRCCKVGIWGAAATVAVCCVIPPLVTVLLVAIGLSIAAPSLDFLLFPVLSFFVAVGAYGWLRQRNKRSCAVGGSPDASRVNELPR